VQVGYQEMIDRTVKQTDIVLDQVSDIFKQFHSSLIQDLAFVQAQMGTIQIGQKPFVYLCLVRCYIQNNQTTLTDCIQIFSKSVSDLSFENDSEWYDKLGEVGNDLAAFCLSLNKPIKGVSPLLKAIKLIQRG